MAYYAASIITGATVAANPHCALRTGASDVNLRFIEFFNSAATSNFVGVGFKGVGTPTPTSSQLGAVLGGTKPASLENVDYAWSAAPGVPTTYFKRVYIAASIGTGMIYAWQKDAPLVVPANSTLVLFNFGATAGGIMSVNWEWEV